MGGGLGLAVGGVNAPGTGGINRGRGDAPMTWGALRICGTIRSAVQSSRPWYCLTAAQFARCWSHCSPVHEPTSPERKMKR